MIGLVFAAAVLFLMLHVTCMALCARALGIGVALVSFGMGPVWFSRGVVRFRVLPVGGYVKLKLAAEEGLEKDVPGACFDMQPRWKRTLLPLSGLCGVLLAASAVLGGAVLDSVFLGFGQLVRGALHPLSTGVETWAAFAQWAAAGPAAVVLATLWCKFAALNLLPSMGSNGVQALLGALAPADRQSRWERAMSPVLLLSSCVLLGGWLVALGGYLI